MSIWRKFETREILEAFEWAANGNIAVHLNYPAVKFKGHVTAHLLARDEGALITAAKSVGCHPKWIQRSRRPKDNPDPKYTHFDLFAAPLEKALEKCLKDRNLS